MAKKLVFVGKSCSGKSTIVDLFRQYGILVIDSDLIAHQLVEPNKPAYKKYKRHKKLQKNKKCAILYIVILRYKKLY